MIDKLNEMLPEIHQWICEDIERDDLSRWDSLIINKLKPHTYRVFTMIGDLRVCLHRFEPCSPDECFRHPHPWPAAFIVMDGRYKHWLGWSDHQTDDEPQGVSNGIVTAGCMYEIVDPRTWHSVQPLVTSYTVMLNGAPWTEEERHTATRTTKGKDLDKMDDLDLREHLLMFGSLLEDMLEDPWGSMGKEEDHRDDWEDYELRRMGYDPEKK